jgi:hypothetical protein
MFQSQLNRQPFQIVSFAQYVGIGGYILVFAVALAFAAPSAIIITRKHAA